MSCKGGDSEAASEVFSLLEDFIRPPRLLELHITDIWESNNTDTETETEDSEQISSQVEKF